MDLKLAFCGSYVAHKRDLTTALNEIQNEQNLKMARYVSYLN